MRPAHVARFGWISAYIALIALMLPSLKSFEAQPRPSLLPPPVGHISADVRHIQTSKLICRHQFPEAYRPFGFRSEIENFAAIRQIYRRGPDMPVSRH